MPPADRISPQAHDGRAEACVDVNPCVSARVALQFAAITAPRRRLQCRRSTAAGGGGLGHGGGKDESGRCMRPSSLVCVRERERDVLAVTLALCAVFHA